MGGVAGPGEAQFDQFRPCGAQSRSAGGVSGWFQDCMLGEQPFQGGPSAGTGEGQSVPCTEAQRSPERPREGPESPESLQNQSKVLILLVFLLTKVWARTSYPSSLQKGFPTSDLRI